MSERELYESGYDGRFGYGRWCEIITRAYRAGQRAMQERCVQHRQEAGDITGALLLASLPIQDPADGEGEG